MNNRGNKPQTLVIAITVRYNYFLISRPNHPHNLTISASKSYYPIISKVWFPVIMNECAIKILQDPHGIHGFTTSFCVRKKQGPLVIAGSMQPVKYTGAPRQDPSVNSIPI